MKHELNRKIMTKFVGLRTMTIVKIKNQKAQKSVS